MHGVAQGPQSVLFPSACVDSGRRRYAPRATHGVARTKRRTLVNDRAIRDTFIIAPMRTAHTVAMTQTMTDRSEILSTT